MKSLSGKEFAKILEQKGWRLARITGNHHIYIKQGQAERITVPIHGNTSLKVGLLKHLMKIAQVSEADF